LPIVPRAQAELGPGDRLFAALKPAGISDACDVAEYSLVDLRIALAEKA
jgi:hypothetical protein